MLRLGVIVNINWSWDERDRGIKNDFFWVFYLSDWIGGVVLIWLENKEDDMEGEEEEDERDEDREK